MTRYARQSDGFRCGPVAMLNALKWAGYRTFWNLPVDRKLAQTTLTCLCKTDKEGTLIEDLEAALGFISTIRLKYHESLTVTKVHSCLKEQGFVIAVSPLFDRGGKKSIWVWHVWSIVEASNDLYTCINFRNSRETREYLTLGQMKYFLSAASGWCLHKG